MCNRLGRTDDLPQQLQQLPVMALTTVRAAAVLRGLRSLPACFSGRHSAVTCALDRMALRHALLHQQSLTRVKACRSWIAA